MAPKTTTMPAIYLLVLMLASAAVQHVASDDWSHGRATL